MTTTQSTTKTAATMMASFEDAYNDTDEDSRSSSPSIHSSERDDECDESIDSLIERYGSKRQHQADEECADEKYGDLDDDDDGPISKPVVRIKLPLFEAPEFIQRLRGYNEATVGTSVSFVAHFKAFPAPTVKWFKDEEEVRATERHLLESSSSTHEGVIRLIINDVRPTDEGAYKCKVENQEGVASTTGYLSVTGGDSRSRKIGRTTSSRSSKLSPATSSPSRSPGVSTPPILRPIVEQKSMEESEERELARQPPSPLQAFINSIRHSAKSKHPPIFYGTENVFGRLDDESGDSDAEDDVFDSEEDAASAATSSDGLEQLPIVSPTSTAVDPDECDHPSRDGCRDETPVVDRKPRDSAGDESDRRESSAGDDIPQCPVGVCAVSVPEESADVPDHRTSPSSSLSSQSAAVGFETDCHASSSNFRQRRLGRMQLLHRLALDLPDELPSTTLSAPRSVFANETESQNYGVASRLCNTDDATAVADVPRVSEPVASSITSQSTTADCCNFDLRHAFRVGQDAVMATVDSPITRFYIAFVVIAAAFANVFDVQPSLLVLIVSLSSFVSFHLFKPRDSGALTSYHSR